MHRVGPDAAAGRIDECELGELARIRSIEEFLQRLGLVGVSASEGPVEEIGVNHASRRVVVHPGVAGVGQLLEDRLLGDTVHFGLKSLVICAMPGAGAGQQSSTIGVGWL